MNYNILEHDSEASEYLINITDGNFSLNIYCQPLTDVNIFEHTFFLELICMFCQIVPQYNISHPGIEITSHYGHIICGLVIDRRKIKVSNFVFLVDFEIEDTLLNQYLTISCERIDF